MWTGSKSDSDSESADGLQETFSASESEFETTVEVIMILRIIIYLLPVKTERIFSMKNNKLYETDTVVDSAEEDDKRKQRTQWYP